jgi:hypothetical protein
MCRSKRITSGFKAAVIEIASTKLLASPNSFIAVHYEDFSRLEGPVPFACGETNGWGKKSLVPI